jgi:hypothetical protein
MQTAIHIYTVYIPYFKFFNLFLKAVELSKQNIPLTGQSKTIIYKLKTKTEKPKKVGDYVDYEEID